MSTPTPTPRTDAAWDYAHDEGGCHTGALRGEMEKLERELAEARESKDRIAKRAERIRCELVEANQQRDRLAGCIIHLMERDWFREGVSGPVTCTLDADAVRAALAAVKGQP